MSVLEGGVKDGVSINTLAVFSAPAMPLLRGILGRTSTRILLKLSFGDPLD
jgi:hypothetical protein